jgi:hypothetical protein
VLAVALTRPPVPIEWDDAAAKPLEVPDPAAEDDAASVIAH